jgi:hypothetical protein
VCLIDFSQFPFILPLFFFRFHSLKPLRISHSIPLQFCPCYVDRRPHIIPILSYTELIWNKCFKVLK